MNKYGLGHFIIFLALILSTHFTFRANDWLGQTFLLLYLPVTFGLFYLIKCFKFIIKPDFVKAKLSAVIFLNYLLITMKLDYSYYNLIVCLLIIVLNGLLIYTLREFSRSKLGTIAALTLALVTLLSFTPDELIFKFINRSDDKINWREDISWSHFKGEIDSEKDNFSASIKSSTVWRINRAYNYPPAISISKMDMSKSWSRAKYQTDNLLNHEQGHFNITEINRRLAMDSIKKVWMSNQIEPIDSIITYYSNQRLDMQAKYDEDSDHFANKEGQIKWDKLISKKLDSLKVN